MIGFLQQKLMPMAAAITLTNVKPNQMYPYTAKISTARAIYQDVDNVA
jgi:hypothetical protein